MKGPDERLWGERLAATYERFAAVLTVGGALVACLALAYLAFEWSRRYWSAGEHMMSLAIAMGALSFSAALVWAVAKRSGAALPLLIIALCFVVLPWLAQSGVWEAVRP